MKLLRFEFINLKHLTTIENNFLPTVKQFVSNGNLRMNTIRWYYRNLPHVDNMISTTGKYTSDLFHLTLLLRKVLFPKKKKYYNNLHIHFLFSLNVKKMILLTYSTQPYPFTKASIIS